MERLYRTMRADADGLPRVGRGARLLGVRVEGPRIDVSPDDHGCVHTGTGGMSVTVDDPAAMPVSRRPRWLADGASEDPLFRLEPSRVVEPLSVRVEARAHAVIEPSVGLTLDAYETSLAATRSFWNGENQP